MQRDINSSHQSVSLPTHTHSHTQTDKDIRASQPRLSYFPSICQRTYFHTSKGHMTWIINKVNRIPTHCGVAYESVRSLARGHLILNIS